MEITKKNALLLWDERYGRQTQTTNDFAGRKISKSSYGNVDSKTGWNIDHIMPLSKGGSSVKCNLEIAHHISNSDKGDKTTFETNGRTFQVRKVKDSSKCYEIVEIEKVVSKARDDRKQIYDRFISDDFDFANRLVSFENFENGKPTSWGFGQIPNSNQLFAAHIDTLKDQAGKTKFKSNDYNFSLRKIDDKYYFLNEDSFMEMYNYPNTIAFSNKIINSNKTIYFDVLSLIGDSMSDEVFSKSILIIEEFLSYSDYEYVLDISRREKHTCHLIFKTPKESDVKNIYDYAVWVNTFSNYINKITGKNGFTIYHWQTNCDSATYSITIKNIDSQFMNLKPWNHYSITQTIMVHQTVYEYLIKLKFDTSTFTNLNNGFYKRGYIFTTFDKLIKKF